MKTILVSGAIANKPFNGGAAWTRLSWLLGLRKLGFETYFVEQIMPQHCVGPDGSVTAFEDSLNLAFFRRIAESFELGRSATLLYGNGPTTFGLPYAELLDAAAGAELLVNISGHLIFEDVKRLPTRKVFIDLDPGYTQFWYAAGDDRARLSGHDFFFTIGENIGTRGNPIPDCGLRWRSTRQPVVLECWNPRPGNGAGRFTTVASWRGPYGRVKYRGRSFGQKVHEFRKFLELPERVPQKFELALDIHPADQRDLELLRVHGWRIADPRRVAADPRAFNRYVQESDAEFSVAQGIYVETNSGWFSDRTVRYLASGKPALVQDSGFSANLPVGEGLLAFRTLEEAVEGAQSIATDYEHHCRAARQIAEEFFDSDKVLGCMLDEVGVTP